MNMFIYIAEHLHFIHFQACLTILYSALYLPVCFNLHQSVSLSAHLPLKRLSCLSMCDILSLSNLLLLFPSSPAFLTTCSLSKTYTPHLTRFNPLSSHTSSSLPFSFFSDSHITLFSSPLLSLSCKQSYK